MRILEFMTTYKCVGSHKSHGRPLSPRHPLGAAAIQLLQVVAMSCLVHLPTPAHCGQDGAIVNPQPVAPVRTPPVAHRDLPKPVADMRAAILAAAKSGVIDDLATAIAWNEITPEFGQAAGEDAIAHLKSLSHDGSGRDVLAVIANLLELSAARLPLGPDVENSAIYVWPYLAEQPLEKLTPSEEVDLYRLMPVPLAAEARASKSWNWWRLSIGADGTWLMFARQNR